MPSLYKIIPVALSFLSFATAAIMPYNARSEMVIEAKRDTFDYRNAAVAYATARLRADGISMAHDIQFLYSVVGPTTETVYLTQTLNTVPFTNAPATVTYSLADQSVVSFTSSFVNPTYIYRNLPYISPLAAATSAATRFDATYPSVDAYTYAYFLTPANAAVFVYVIDVQTADGVWITAYVDTEEAIVLSAVDKATGVTIL